MAGSKTASPLVPVSWGELIDKITILEIKAAELLGVEALLNVRTELSKLEEVARTIDQAAGLNDLRRALTAINRQLWDVEDHLRLKERDQDFGQEFIALARAVYGLNDQRASLKSNINVLLGSALREEKSYGERIGT